MLPDSYTRLSSLFANQLGLKTVFLFICLLFLIAAPVDANTNKPKGKSERLLIAIPISEQILMQEDPYFVLLKRAVVALDMDVLFVEVNGARSLKQLHQGKIAGSYPRYAIIAEGDPDLVPVEDFGRPNSLYAYSNSVIDQAQMERDFVDKYYLFGAVRGVLVLERKFEKTDFNWFGHVDHLVGALKAERIRYIVEADIAMERFIKAGVVLNRSEKPVYEGRVTLVMNENYRPIAEKLSEYFKSNPVF